MTEPTHTCTGAQNGLTYQPCLACERNFAATGDRYMSAEMRDSLRIDSAAPMPDELTCPNCDQIHRAHQCAVKDPPWRVGRSLGRSIYKDETFVALADTPELASEIVAAANEAHWRRWRSSLPISDPGGG